jgi:transposase
MYLVKGPIPIVIPINNGLMSAVFDKYKAKNGIAAKLAPLAKTVPASNVHTIGWYALNVFLILGVLLSLFILLFKPHTRTT